MKKFFKSIVDYFNVGHLVLLIPVCFFAIYDSVFQSFAAIVADLTAQYPDVPLVNIQAILTIPSLIMVPTTLLSGILAHYLGSKRIAELSCAFLAVGGLMPAFWPNPPIGVIYASAILIGCGQGFLHPLASSLICLVWDNHDQRSRVLGFKQAVNYIGGSAASIIVGFLALWSWQATYLVYLGIIPVWLIAHFFLPEVDDPARMEEDGKKKVNLSGYKQFLRPDVLYLLFLFMVVMMFLYAYRTNISLLFVEKGLGSSVEVSVVTATVSMASFVLGIVYGEISRKLRGYRLTAGLYILALGMLIMMLAPSMPVMLIGAAIFGVGTGMQEINSVFYISHVTTKDSTALAISLMLCFVSFGSFISPYVLTPLAQFIFGEQAAINSFILATIGFAICGTIELIHAIRGRRDTIMVAPTAEVDSSLELGDGMYRESDEERYDKKEDKEDKEN